jgi:predicted XRE-type DNA-binding protein
MAQNAKYRGADNVLADLGFPDAEELTTKTILAKQLNEVIDSRHLTRPDAAELLEMPQHEVSAIRNYKLRDVSLERLRRTLTALG